MATEVKVPSMGESITSGILASWHVKDGDFVKSGQAIYELETDKITSEANAEVSGKISLKASEGDEVEIGQVVAEIDESAAEDGGDNAPGDEKKQQDQPESSEKEESPDEAPSKAGKKESDDTRKTDGDSDKPHSPAVRRIAAETGIDPNDVSGSGKGGRVTKGDMLTAAEKKDTPGEEAKKESDTPKPGGAPIREAPTTGTGDRTSRKKMSPLRKRIAERLVQSQRESAILTTFNEVDMSRVMELRKKHQDAFVEKHGIKLGFMSIFCKAVVYALKEVPAINAQIEGDELVQNHFYDIGVAIGTDRGLIVPVLRTVDQLSYAEIEQAIIEYARKAKDGKITVEDLQGGCFTISNGGIYGSLLSTPIINPPQSGILGMHTIQQRPVVVDGEIVARPMMYLALSYDHRIVDGKEAVTFLVKMKQVIEDPTRLIFGL
ncbi:MAG: 2-oxoglutarate dehydrogenase complex dihydrolipoyllysine-residue succinyltransferase [Opitutales bacterium]